MKTITELKSKLSQKTLRSFKEYWGGDDQSLVRFLPGSYVNAPLIKYFSTRNIDIKEKKVLEFGCCHGSSFISFLSHGAKQIVGVDINKETMSLSKMIYDDLGYKNVSYRLSSTKKQLPLGKDEFDIISCNAVLEHIHPAKRSSYILELQKALKPGGYFIISDTPNRLWIKENHTTGLWFLNYLPFKIKCFLGSKTKRFRGEYKSGDYKFRGKDKGSDYKFWIKQGIIGVSYADVAKLFNKEEWENKHDLAVKKEYKDYFLKPKNKKILKKFGCYFLFLLALIFDNFYLKKKKYPSLAILPALIFSFKKTSLFRS